MTDYHWTSDDGLRLYAQEFGSDRGKLPVVCIPGLTRNSRDFDQVAPWIASLGRRVFAVDLRGRGRSARDSVPKRYHPKTYADDMAALLRSLQVPRAVFIGTSLGGLVLMTLATRHPALIGASVINDVGPEIPDEAIARISSYAGKAPKVSNWNDAAAYSRHTMGVAFPAFSDADWAHMARRSFIDDANGKPVLDYDSAIFRPTPRWMIRLLTPLLWMAWRRLARQAPVLLLRGSTSDVLPSNVAARMLRGSLAVTMVEVPGVGHAPTLDEPASRQALEAFLQQAK